jgi:hypothetical protein
MITFKNNSRMLCAAVALAGMLAVPLQAAEPANNAEQQSLRVLLGGLRLMGANSGTGLWPGNTEAIRKAMATLAPTTLGEGELLSQFLADSTESVVMRGTTAISGWRDPLTDVWLIGQWSNHGSSAVANWQVERMSFALTQDLLDTSKRAAMPVTKLFPQSTEMNLGAAMTEAHQRAVKAFQVAARGDLAKLPWAGDDRARRAKEVALQRLDAARLSRVAMTKRSANAAEQVYAALVEDTPATHEVSDSIAKALAALPTEVRISLRSVAYLPARDRVYAVVQSPAQPSLIYLAQLQASAAGEAPRVTNVQSIDLSKAE